MESFELIEFLQRHFGWTMTGCLLLIVSVVTIFTRGVSEALVRRIQDSLQNVRFRKLRRIDIMHHPIFAKYHFLINQRLKYINCRCVLRRKIFSGLMTIRLEVYDRLLREHVQRNDVNSLSITEFQYETKEFLYRALSEWQEKAQHDGVPQVVIDRFIESTNDIRRSFFLFVESVSNSTYSYVDNVSRTSAIFDMLSAFEEALLVKLEKSLDNMDGEISRSSYKGVVCQRCPACQFEQ